MTADKKSNPIALLLVLGSVYVLIEILPTLLDHLLWR